MHEHTPAQPQQSLQRKPPPHVVKPQLWPNQNPNTESTHPFTQHMTQPKAKTYGNHAQNNTWTQPIQITTKLAKGKTNICLSRTLHNHQKEDPSTQLFREHNKQQQQIINNNRKQAAASSQQPTANSKQPVASSQQPPASNKQQPAATSQ